MTRVAMWPVIRAVLAACLGVASRSQLDHDAANLNPIAVIVTAVLLIVIFVLTLLIVIHLIT